MALAEIIIANMGSVRKDNGDPQTVVSLGARPDRCFATNSSDPLVITKNGTSSLYNTKTPRQGYFLYSIGGPDRIRTGDLLRDREA